MLESYFTGRVEQHVEYRSLRGGEQDIVHEGLVFISTAVTTDEFHARAAQPEPKHPRVGRVDHVKTYDVAHCGVTREMKLAVDQHHVPEPAHRRERRPVQTFRPRRAEPPGGA